MKLSSSTLLLASACVVAAISGTEAKPDEQGGLTLEEKQEKCQELATLADGIICDMDKYCSTLCKYDDIEDEAEQATDDEGDDDDDDYRRRLRASPGAEGETRPRKVKGKPSPARGLCRCCNLEAEEPVANPST